MSQQPDQLIIVLHLLDAINFHRSKNTPIVLSASLDRNVLETASRLPGIASTSFDSNLVWETDRRSVKRMKMENLPIRIECYSINQTNSEQSRSLVGHVLLPLRSIPLLPSTKANTLKPRWHRVIGLHSQEWKSQKPEIQLMVMITDKNFLLAEKKTDAAGVDGRTEADQSVVIFANPEPSRLGSGGGMHIRLLEDRGLLQVGSYEQECDIFLVKVVLKYAKRMQRLLDAGNELASVQMRYDLLGDTYPCMLERKPNGIYLIQEKIVINFRTSLHSLKRYFENAFLIRLEVLSGDKLVGRARLRFGELIHDEPLSDFITKHRENSHTMDVEKYYTIEQASDKYEQNDIPDAVSDHSTSLIPAVKCKFTLKYLSTDRKHIPDSIQKATQSVPENDPSEGIPALALEIPEIPSVPSINLNETRSIHPPPAAQPEKTDIETILHCEGRDLRDVPRTFSYNLLLQSVRFNVRPSIGMWQLSLHHPRADTPLTKVTLELNTIESETLEFPNLQLKLYFSSLPDLVLETITADSSKLTLHGPHGLFGFARLDNQSLVVGTKEKQAGVAILESQNGESIGMATIFCFLDEVGINYNSRAPVSEPSIAATPRAQLDDQVSYRMLEEQKQWMIKQREMFVAELKRKESAHLLRLSNEWKKRRAKENEELTEKMEHVSALTRALEETRRSLTLQDIRMVEQNQAVEEMKTKLEISYQQKLSDIREKAARLEEDLNHRSKLQTLQCDELELKNDSLTHDNDQLRRANERLEGELATAKKETESCINLRHQLNTLGQKLRETEQSKLFYKQQWAKMVRELNKMKQENVEQLKNVLGGEERRTRSFHWDAEPNPCCIQNAEADEELNKIHQLIFEEQSRQQHQCCSTDHCC